MIEILPESQGNLLGVKARVAFTDRDFREVLLPRLESIIQDCGKARVLLYLEQGFGGWDLETLKREEFGPKYKDELEKIAVVGGSWWLKLQLKLAAPLLAGEVQTFAREELTAAWQWLKA